MAAEGMLTTPTAYAAVDPSRAVGVMGDKRVYGYVCHPSFPPS